MLPTSTHTLLCRDRPWRWQLQKSDRWVKVKWCVVQAMADQGSGGAYEISQRMTAMVGWGATTNFQEDWTWDQAAQTYALDKDMADKLRKNNPQVGFQFPLSCCVPDSDCRHVSDMPAGGLKVCWCQGRLLYGQVESR